MTGTMQMNPEQVLDELVNYHAAPPKPDITEPTEALRLEPEVGVPVHLPAMNQFGASWEGGSVVPMKNQRAAIFRYTHRQSSGDRLHLQRAAGPAARGARAARRSQSADQRR